VVHIAVYNYMFLPLSAIVRLFYLLYLKRLYLYHCIQLYLNYSKYMTIYNSCERVLVTNDRCLAYCVVFLYNSK